MMGNAFLFAVYLKNLRGLKMGIHNPKRLGELWDKTRLDVILDEINAISDKVVLSGGWAWHFMTPENHIEYKHAHDHKDVDIFVKPENFAELITQLKQRGYDKTWTRFDRLPGSETFSRYTKIVQLDRETIKVILDVFVGNVPTVNVRIFTLVEPKFLLSLYGVKHSSDRCFAVKIASELLQQGINPIGHSEMANYQPFLSQY